MDIMQAFTTGLKPDTWMLLDASARGTMKIKTTDEVHELIHNISLNKYRGNTEEEVTPRKKAVEESILQHLQSKLGRTSKSLTEATMFYNHNRQTAPHPLPQGTQQQPPRSSLEEMISQNAKNTQGQIDRLTKQVDEMKKRHEVCMKNLEVYMGQLSTDLANATRTRLSETTLDNPRNETCKMVEVEKDEEKESDLMMNDVKFLEEFELLVKELKTPRDVLQTRKVTRNQCCNNLLEYLFSPADKPLCDKTVVVTQKFSKKYEDTSPKKNEDPDCFSVPVMVRGFYVSEVMCDLVSSVNMMSLSLFNKIGGMELKPFEGVIETMNINIDGFTFPIEVVVMKIKGLNIAQMILERPFLVTARDIINVDQGEIIIRLGKDYITYKVYGQDRHLKQNGVPKLKPNLKVEEDDEIKELEGHGLPSTS
ncbi:hypothetical protein MTR_2g069520 [Medicago truncatula]|uniref:Uncharacterized protein n=1 Tax=Medicago truncatula TaxID=3880 RepID=G7IJA5_MEDTR|nr:hypothetical protein MTR_2g069520 [Medicago truncatula]